MAERLEVELDLSSVNQIGIARPGDTVVVTFGRHLHDEEFEFIQGRFHELYPDLRFLPFDGGAEVTIIRAGEDNV